MYSQTKLLLLPLLVAASSFGYSNTSNKEKPVEPTLQCIVTDASTKKPVQGVSVFVSTNKCQEKKELITDALGNFMLTDMDNREVTIVLEKKGYKTFKREKVLLKKGSSLKLNLDLTTEDEPGFFHPLMRMMNE